MAVQQVLEVVSPDLPLSVVCYLAQGHVAGCVYLDGSPIQGKALFHTIYDLLDTREGLVFQIVSEP